MKFKIHTAEWVIIFYILSHCSFELSFLIILLQDALAWSGHTWYHESNWIRCMPSYHQEQKGNWCMTCLPSLGWGFCLPLKGPLSTGPSTVTLVKSCAVLRWRAHSHRRPSLIMTFLLGFSPFPCQHTPIWDWISVCELPSYFTGSVNLV